MKIGRTQETIIAYMRELPDGVGYIGTTTQAPKYFGGLSWEQVEDSLIRLQKRGIIKQVRGRMNGIYRLEKMRGYLDTQTGEALGFIGRNKTHQWRDSGGFLMSKCGKCGVWVGNWAVSSKDCIKVD